MRFYLQNQWPNDGWVVSSLVSTQMLYGFQNFCGWIWIFQFFILNTKSLLHYYSGSNGKLLASAWYNNIMKAWIIISLTFKMSLCTFLIIYTLCTHKCRHLFVATRNFQNHWLFIMDVHMNLLHPHRKVSKSFVLYCLSSMDSCSGLGFFVFKHFITAIFFIHLSFVLPKFT